MSIVRINAITVPEGAGDELLSRFENRVGEVENMEGFESFELLRPNSASNTWYVYTRWESEEAGHAEANARPVAHGSELLEFEVVLKAERNQNKG